ncbi:MAG: hypothetical protein ABS951_09395 [Solibacillus sp.]
MATMDGFLVLFLITFLGLFHYIAHLLYTRKNVPHWASAIGIILLTPLVIFVFYIPIGLRLVDLIVTESTRVEIGMSGTFILFVLLIQAIGLFIYGIFKQSYTLWKQKRHEPLPCPKNCTKPRTYTD